jgi:hypothetical protein
VDIDGDGHLDILSGSYSRMETKMAGLFQVLYGNVDGTFRKAEVLKGTDGEPLIIPLKADDQMTENICTRPFAVDWDGDGHLDLVVGNFAGTFYWFKGEGKGKFNPKPEMIMAGDEPLRIPGAHSDPFVVDWDGDGDLDIVSGSANGGVYWAENTAGKGKPPKLKQFRQLIKPIPPPESGTPLQEKDLTGPTHATRIWIDDLNGDGKLDILVGDSVTLVSPAKGLTVEEMKSKLKDWDKEFQKAMEAMTAAGEDEKAREKANKEYQNIYKRRSEIINEEMTGYVWVYLQR